MRVKLLSISLLLCLALACMLFSAVGTIQAYQRLQQNHQRILAGDVSSIDAWMTLPYIARVYHIPEGCLYQSLRLPNTWMVRHSTLRVIADHYARPINQLIQDMQRAILNYRKDHTVCSSLAPPTPASGSKLRKRSPLGTRKGIVND